MFNDKIFNDILITTANPATNFSTKIGCSIYNNMYDEIDKHIVSNWDEIKEKAKDYEAKREHDKIVARQKRNRFYRSLAKHVHWSGNTCIVYWNDGTQTKSHWDSAEDFDPEKAILVCMARKLYGDTNIYNEVLKKYCEDGWDHYEKEFLSDEWNY